MYMGAEPCERTQFRVDSMHIELPASSKQARAGDTYHSSASILSVFLLFIWLANATLPTPTRMHCMLKLSVMYIYTAALSAGCQ